MSETAKILEHLLATTPDMRHLLEQLADRCDKAGDLSGTMTLGNRADLGARLGSLQGLFPVKAVAVSRAGKVTLRFDAIFQKLDADRREAWIAALYATLGRTRRNRSAERRHLAVGTADLLASWRLAFPELTTIADSLEATPDAWERRARANGLDALSQQLFLAGEIVRFLAQNRQPIAGAELAARFAGDSKALRPGDLRSLVIDWLAILADDPEAERGTLLSRFQVVDNSTAIKVTLFGPLVYTLGGRRFDWISQLWQVGQAATLSWDNLRDIEQVEIHSETALTCENETPFCRLAREAHPGLTIYTAGFPNASVCRLVELLPSSCRLRHWGDTDLAGLCIAAQLHAIHPLTLWRCDRPTILRLRHALTPLTPHALERAQRWLQSHPAFPFAPELAATIAHGWLEQEAWSPS